jgi:hypothetical protein
MSIMEFRNIVITLGLAAGSALFAGCASAPAANAAAVPATPAPKVTTAPPEAAATAEADTAAGLEKRFQEAARSYKVVQKDGKTMYCKRERVMGSTIPTLQCITEAQLRTQVENTDEIRQKMRNRAGCAQMGCGGGG